MSDWLEIVVPVSAPHAEDVAALLCKSVEAARAGTELRSAEVVFWVPVDQGEHALAATRAAVRSLAKAGLGVDPDRVRACPALPEQQWRDAWKKYFRTIRLTRQIVVVPSWDTFSPGSDDIPIHLDPGQAFGTGAHATTQLMLEALQRLRDGGAQVHTLLDVGTGSGILAIAALKLWPTCTAVAIDLDPLALQATCENSEANAVLDRIRVVDTPVGNLDATSYDVVVANIQAHVLLDLRRDIASRVGDTLLMSGLLTAQARSVAEAYRDHENLHIRDIRASEADAEWSAVELGVAP